MGSRHKGLPIRDPDRLGVHVAVDIDVEEPPRSRNRREYSGRYGARRARATSGPVRAQIVPLQYYASGATIRPSRAEITAASSTAITATASAGVTGFWPQPNSASRIAP